MTTSTAISSPKGAVMLFTTTVIAATIDEALAKLERHADRAGVKATGRVSVRSERHHLIDVETELVGDRNDAWVILTSYGMSPSKALGSTWQDVAGVGRFEARS